MFCLAHGSRCRVCNINVRDSENLGGGILMTSLPLVPCASASVAKTRNRLYILTSSPVISDCRYLAANFCKDLLEIWNWFCNVTTSGLVDILISCRIKNFVFRRTKAFALHLHTRMIFRRSWVGYQAYKTIH